jgi:hypothetical protein
MVQSSLPWGTSTDAPGDIPPMYQERWRSLFGGLAADGIVGDLTGNALKVTIVDATHVSVTAGEAVIRGAHYLSTATETLVRPNTTWENVVLRYDPAAQAVTLECTGGASFPGAALAQDPDGTWEIALARIQRSSGAVTDLRRWVGPVVVSNATSTGNVFQGETPPLGTVLIFPRDPSSTKAVDGLIQVRTLVGGVPAWRQITPTPWANTTAISVPSSTDLVSPGADLSPVGGGFLDTLPLRWRQTSGALEISGAVMRRTAGGSSSSWSGPVRAKVAEIPAARVITGASLIPLTAVVSKDTEPSAGAGFGETVAAAWLQLDESVYSLYVAFPPGTWSVVSVHAVVQSTGWVE